LLYICQEKQSSQSVGTPALYQEKSHVQITASRRTAAEIGVFGLLKSPIPNVGDCLRAAPTPVAAIHYSPSPATF